MKLPPFDKVLFEPLGLKYLGALPDAVSRCLKEAIADIKRRKLKLETPITWRLADGPWFVTVCQHLIYASENRQLNTLVILEIMPDLGDDDDEFL
jgi:hypothetical protein